MTYPTTAPADLFVDGSILGGALADYLRSIAGEEPPEMVMRWVVP